MECEARDPAHSHLDELSPGGILFRIGLAFIQSLRSDDLGCPMR